MKKILLLSIAFFGIFTVQAQVKAMDTSRSFTATKTNKITPEKLAGKVVVMVFWNTTDQQCLADLPEIMELSNSYKNDKEVVFLAPTPETSKNIGQYLHGGTGNLRIIPEAYDLIRQYQVTTFPTYLVFNREGQPSFTGNPQSGSATAKDQLSEQITKLKSR